MTMNTMKTLVLTATTVLSVGVGAVLVQGEMSGAGDAAYFSRQLQTASPTANRSGAAQSRSSEIDTSRSQSPYSGAHTGLFNFN